MNRLGVRLGLLVLVLAALAVVVLGARGSGTGDGGASSSAGTPTSELSLADAASRPNGVAAGQQPALDVGRSGSSRPDVDAGALMDGSDDVGANGCHTAYGDSGQCLTAAPPSGEEHVHGTAGWTCEQVRRSFPEGIEVKHPGHDPLALDRNADGVACDPTD
jgi:hypothetical protein